MFTIDIENLQTLKYQIFLKIHYVFLSISIFYSKCSHDDKKNI